MKAVYLKPEMDVITISEYACIATSTTENSNGTENFGYKDGAWN